jgi:hypothetical protein
VQHDDEGWRCLVACLFAAIRERLFAAITAVVNPSRRPETQAADRSPRPGFVPSADAWAHEPGAGWLAPAHLPFGLSYYLRESCRRTRKLHSIVFLPNS